MSWTAAIGAGSGLLSTLFGNRSRRREARRAHDRALQKMDKQQQHNIDMFDRTNAHNHPAAQLQRKREAGLNPALMGAEGAAHAQQGAGIGAADGAMAPQADLPDPFSKYLNLQKIEAQTNHIREMSRNTAQNTAYQMANTIAKTIHNEFEPVTRALANVFTGNQINLGRLEYLFKSNTLGDRQMYEAFRAANESARYELAKGLKQIKAHQIEFQEAMAMAILELKHQQSRQAAERSGLFRQQSATAELDRGFLQDFLSRGLNPRDPQMQRIVVDVISNIMPNVQQNLQDAVGGWMLRRSENQLRDWYRDNFSDSPR